MSIISAVVNLWGQISRAKDETAALGIGLACTLENIECFVVTWCAERRLDVIASVALWLTGVRKYWRL